MKSSIFRGGGWQVPQLVLKKMDEEIMQRSINRISEELGYPYDQLIYVKYKEEQMSYNDISRLLREEGIKISNTQIATHAEYSFGPKFSRDRKEINEFLKEKNLKNKKNG